MPTEEFPGPNDARNPEDVDLYVSPWVWKCLLGIGTPLAVAAAMGGFSAFLTVRSLAQDYDHTVERIQKNEHLMSRVDNERSAAAKERSQLREHIGRIDERIRALDTKLDLIIKKIDD